MRDQAEGHPRELLSAFLDGEVTPAEKASVEAHLSACAGCRALLAEMERLDRMTAGEEVPAVPAGLEARIRGRIGSEVPATRPEPFTRRRMGPFLRVPIAAAAAFAGVLALWIAVKGFERTELTPAARPGGVEREVASEPKKESREAPSDREEGAPAPGITQAVPGPDLDRIAEKDADGRGRLAEAPPEESVATDEAGGEHEGGLEGFVPVPQAPSAPARPAGGEEERMVLSSEKQAAPPPAALRTFAAAPPPSPRRLSLEEDDLEIVLDESGHLTLAAGGYSCSLDLPPAEAVPDLFAPLPEAALRESDEKGGPASVRALSGAAPEPGGRRTDGSLLMTEPDGSTRWLTAGNYPPEADEQGGTLTPAARLRRLVFETHRARVEEACGRLPESISP